MDKKPCDCIKQHATKYDELKKSTQQAAIEKGEVFVLVVYEKEQKEILSAERFKCWYDQEPRIGRIIEYIYG